ncbi:MAG TPA: hypothetical protein VJK25_02285 [Patescibacteria group bacterium]|nr:hypothetical protein [Patescibacteria group bacterium]
MEKYKKLKQQTELEYKKVVGIHCPALQAEVIFNSDGFHHLRYDSCRTERHKKSQSIKFLYFPKAVEVIQKSTTIQEYRRSICPIGKPNKNGLRKTSAIEWFAFWSIISFAKKIRIRTVVRRVGGDDGYYHFWSVMPFWNLSHSQRIIGSKEIEDE